MKHDTHTVKQAINGNTEAFEALLYASEEKLYYTALSYMKNKEDALDAIQEATCKAYLSLKQLKKPEFFSTWLFRILICECYRLLKHKQRVLPYEESELIKRLPHKQTEKNDTVDISGALSQLNYFYQTAIILYYYHDLSIKQIAEVMDKPVGTIKTYLYRGKKQLKQELERREGLYERYV
ncbi:sigma-70 family RNA polymerase sigma factor [Ectobacillus antri]|jgi:RNA polymerase sigma-70 factor (TIGR02954 family)|uniref:Sigma-70 family RNA polymerase sigma factor n=1 Tax=Ectobacillus antri TaxID=2486280 RepID=A0ABT6H6L0_9BACI|nr:sigma-70 family RNA polymerase sigma factor [Ectobacillus antri]MDG4657294.1 sigma-70 family RNA polymerase sigma factor [Ectobacillus antri]MDG5754354.1 sigma-70 family RNA polymerase sigma factor [Ectobacillus antri]